MKDDAACTLIRQRDRGSRADAARSARYERGFSNKFPVHALEYSSWMSQVLER